MEKENKKRGIFRIFNVFDLVLIALAVLLLGALVVSRFFGGSGDGTGSPLPLTVGTVPVRYVIDATLEDEDRDCVQVGDELVDKIQHYDLGRVESIEYRDATRRVVDYEREQVVNAVIPGQVTLRLTVSARAAVSESKILVDGGVQIKLGSGVTIVVNGHTVTGTVMGIDRG